VRVVAVVVAGLVVGTVVVLVVVDDDDGGRRELRDLEPALLTEDDVGADFTRQTGDEDEDEEEEDAGIPDDAQVSDECREALERLESFESDVEESSDAGDDFLEVVFDRQDDGDLDDNDDVVTHQLSFMQFDAPSLAEVAELSRCDQITYAQNGVRVEQSMDADELDSLGNQAVWYESNTDVTLEDGTEVSFESFSMVAVREGVVSSVSMTTQAEGVDHDLVDELATTADDRVRQVLDG
jgi:hypothetical protein